MVVEKTLSQHKLDIYFSQSKCLSEVLLPRKAPRSEMVGQQFRLTCTNIYIPKMGTSSFYSFHNALNINVEIYSYSQISTWYFAKTLEVPNFYIYFLPII